MSDVTEQEREPLVANPDDRIGAPLTAPRAPSADSPFSDDMTVFPGGERRVPATERPFFRMVNAYIKQYAAPMVNKDQRVQEAQAKVDELYADRKQAGEEEAQRVYDEAMEEPTARLAAAEQAFAEAKAAAKTANAQWTETYNTVYSAALDDSIEDQRAELLQAVEAAKAAEREAKREKKNVNAAPDANKIDEEVDTSELDPEALAEHMRKKREALHENRTTKSEAAAEAEQALADAQKALADFDYVHDEDIKFAKAEAKKAADAKRTKLVTARADAKAELGEAKADVKAADKVAKQEAKEAGEVAQDRFDDQIDDAELAVDTAKQTVRDELNAEREAAVDAYRNAPPGPVKLGMARLGELMTKGALGIKGLAVGALEGAARYASSYQSDRTKAARTIEVLETSSSETIDQLTQFDRAAAAQIQGKLVALAKVNETIDLSEIDNVADLNQALRESGATQRDLHEAGRDLDQGNLPFGVPTTGAVAAKFGLVDANTVDSLVTAQAGQQLMTIADGIDTYDRADQGGMPADQVIDILQRAPQPGLDTGKPAATDIADGRMSAQGALKLGQLVDGLIAIDPELMKSSGFKDAKADLAALGKTALSEAEGFMRITSDPATRDIARVNNRSKQKEADHYSTGRLAQFVEQSISTLESKPDALSAEQATKLRAMAQVNLQAANQVFVGRQERAEMRNLRVPTPPTTGATA